MEMQQIMQMLAKLQASQDYYQEKMAADRKADKEERRKANQEFLARMKEDRKADQEDLLARMDNMYAKMAKADKQEEMLTEINAKTKAILADTKARRDKRLEANTNDDRNESTACEDVTEDSPEKMEPNPQEKEAVVEREDVPNEDIAVIPVKGLKKRRRGRKSTAGRRREPKELNQANCGSRKKLAAACREVPRRATVA
jgi:hypothetical protein